MAALLLPLVDCSGAALCSHVGVADPVEEDGEQKVPLTLLDERLEPQAFVLLTLPALLGVIAMLEKRATELRRRG